VPFRVPAGIKLVRVNPRTGMRAGPGEPSILEAFKPGTAPPDGYSVIGVSDSEGRPMAPPPQQPQPSSNPFGGIFGNSGPRGLY
jgi:penicillin-binding protein 1A